MKGELIEIRNRYGYPEQVFYRPQPQPPDPVDLKKLFLWSMLMSAIVGGVVVAIAFLLVDQW